MKTYLLNLHNQKGILKYFLLVFLTVFFNNCFAQLNDDFSDGNFTSNPAWTGDIPKFIINDDFKLQLNDDDAGCSVLLTLNNLIQNTEWIFLVKMSFSPSSNNHARIYLCSDDTEFSNTYFLQLGESGSDDAIELFKKEGDNIFSVCRSQDGIISSSFEIRMKVQHNENNEWLLYADVNGGNNFSLLASGTDDYQPLVSYFGLECNYTSSNSTKFYFDDFVIQQIIADTIPPEVVECKAINKNSIELLFNETITKESAVNADNYFLEEYSCKPANIQFDELSGNKVSLTFNESWQNGSEYSLKISNISDIENNIMISQMHTFNWFKPLAFDVVINEIFADPSPRIALPEYEYIELANNTSYEISLENWILMIGDSEKKFGNVTIKPNSYLLLAHEDAEQEVGILGDFYGFSSFSLSNAGQDLNLYDEDRKSISSVSYDDSWYKDPEKENGGYSLEQIDPLNPCGGSINWKASEHVTGGTPGDQNTVFKIQNLRPEILGLEYINEQIIQLNFSHIMDVFSVTNSLMYELDHGFGNPDSVAIKSYNPTSVLIYPKEAISKGIIYTLSLVDTVYNCSGLLLAPQQHFSFGIPSNADSNDVVINEILFHCLDNGSDYIELYNRSEKILDISDLSLAIVKEKFPDPNDTNRVNISSKSQLLFPAQYLLLSEQPEWVKQQYYTPNPENFVGIDEFPTLNNTNGKILLYTNNSISDIAVYDEEMHYPLLQYFDGVSLERINFNKPTLEKDNWISASEASGFGTPGYQNSQFNEYNNTQEPIALDSDIFSPNGDGYLDVVNINYVFTDAGTHISILIFDVNGLLVNTLIDNEYCGTEGIFCWNGKNENGQIANTGMYVVLIKTFTTHGEINTYKKVVALVSG